MIDGEEIPMVYALKGFPGGAIGDYIIEATLACHDPDNSASGDSVVYATLSRMRLARLQQRFAIACARQAERHGSKFPSR